MTDEERCKKLGTAIAQARKKRGISQRKLSEQIFVSQQAVANWESGKSWPSIPSMLSVAISLHVDISELLTSISM